MIFIELENFTEAPGQEATEFFKISFTFKEVYLICLPYLLLQTS